MAEYAEELWELMQVPSDALEDVFPPLKVAFFFFKPKRTCVNFEDD